MRSGAWGQGLGSCGGMRFRSRSVLGFRVLYRSFQLGFIHSLSRGKERGRMVHPSFDATFKGDVGFYVGII